MTVTLTITNINTDDIVLNTMSVLTEHRPGITINIPNTVCPSMSVLPDTPSTPCPTDELETWWDIMLHKLTQHDMGVALGEYQQEMYMMYTYGQFALVPGALDDTIDPVAIQAQFIDMYVNQGIQALSTLKTIDEFSSSTSFENFLPRTPPFKTRREAEMWAKSFIKYLENMQELASYRGYFKGLRPEQHDALHIMECYGRVLVRSLHEMLVELA